jgi:hypothetical protein
VLAGAANADFEQRRARPGPTAGSTAGPATGSSPAFATSAASCPPVPPVPADAPLAYTASVQWKGDPARVFGYLPAAGPLWVVVTPMTDCTPLASAQA